MVDPALSFLIAAVRAAYDDEAAGGLSGEAVETWVAHELPKLAARHRVEGLVWDGLARCNAELPADVAETLKTASQSVALENLSAATLLSNLTGIFRSADIDHLVLKGLPLAAICYPHPDAKQSCDIDLLVDPSSLGAAARLLGESGFDIVEPAQVGRLDTWHRTRKESVWHHAALDVQLDLHTQAVDDRQSNGFFGMDAARQTVELAAGSVETYADEPLYAYLCLHGASSAWFRLKWLADLDAFLHRRADVPIERWHDAAVKLGAGRASAQALLLLESLFGLPLPPSVREPLRGHAAVRLLVGIAHRQIANPVEPTMRRLGTLPIRFAQGLGAESLPEAVRSWGAQLHEIATRRLVPTR